MASSLVPNYEVKLLMNPSTVLGSDNKLKDAVKSALSITSGAKKMNIQFLDTDKKDFSENRWNLRIRKSEDEESIELTYKRRYPLVIEAPGPDIGIQATAEPDMSSILATATNEGFDSTTAYEAQWEVGYQKLTLSLSYSVSPSDTGLSDMDLPLEEASRELLRASATKEFDNWQNETWAAETLENSRIYGPVSAKRWKGKFKGTKLAIEVWLVKEADGPGLEPIVEVSFKTANFADGLLRQKELQVILEAKGWFVPDDSLKTAIIMDRY